jgi:hypothetical protein
LSPFSYSNVPVIELAMTFVVGADVLGARDDLHRLRAVGVVVLVEPHRRADQRLDERERACSDCFSAQARRVTPNTFSGLFFQIS